ncbi:MAG TPA: rhodanese-like domain-containing protein [Actinomycetota bacterium]|jgi:rhodanese-related sulfurtransferase|nr:rhodanese-like domain-containing protein [Actinomycetota bacterium]
MKDLQRQEVRELMEKGVQLVEVLPPGEFDEDHLPGAINLTLARIETEAATTLDRTRPIIVYCWDSA